MTGNDPLLSRVGETTTLAGAVRGLAVSQMLGTACEVGLPNALGPGDALGIADLAHALGCHQGALRRLVRALAARGVFAIDQHGTVRHTPNSLLLRTDAASSQHWAARYWTLPAVWAAWGSLGHSVRTGEPAFPHANGRAFFRHMDEVPADREVFQSLMQGGFAGRHEAVASALTFAPGETVVDVGGGSGALLRAVLTRHAGTRGVLYDLPSVVALAPTVLDTPELWERCQVIGGDFFRSVPASGTTYLLCWVLHDWPDEAAVAILRRVRAAMTPGARLVIVDRLLDDDPARCDANDLREDLNMLVLFGGGERTASEFNALMVEAGLTAVRPTLVQPLFSLLEAYPEGSRTV